MPNPHIYTQQSLREAVGAVRKTMNWNSPAMLADLLDNGIDFEVGVRLAGYCISTIEGSDDTCICCVRKFTSCRRCLVTELKTMMAECGDVNHE